ncbi:MAG: hypothetical protein ABIN58_12180 [candidate division WOR-3 bacterium]
MADPVLVAVDGEVSGRSAIGASGRKGDASGAEVLVVPSNGFGIEVEDGGAGAPGRLWPGG